jgi:hypothetical protein
MTQQRKLLKEDQSILHSINYDLRAYIGRLHAIKNAFEALELGPFTSDTWKLLKSGHVYEEIEQQYWEAQDSQLKSAGITNKIIRESVMNGSKGPIEAFREAVRELVILPMKYSQVTEYVSFANNDFELTEGYETEVLEKYCREYVNQGGEADFLEVVEGLHKAFEKYVQAAEKVEATRELSDKGIHFFDRFFQKSGDQWVLSREKVVWYYRFCRENMTVDPSIKHRL